MENLRQTLVCLTLLVRITSIHGVITITEPLATTPLHKVNPEIREDVSTVTTVIQCVATTTNPKATLFYTMALDPDDGRFTFDYTTGLLSTTADPKFEADGTAGISVYTATLIVSSGDESKSKLVKFLIPIEEINEPPRITNLPASVKINENDKGDYSLISLKVEDPDDTVWTYTSVVTPPGTDTKFELNGIHNGIKISGEENEIWLKLNPGLNYEEVQDFNVSIVATDIRGLKSTPLFLHVELRDINEPPEFTDSVATASVYEESPIGTTLITSIAPIRARDPDIKKNDTVKYIIEGKYSNYFNIYTYNEEAVITVAKRIDREDLHNPIDGNFELFVSALDRLQLRQSLANTFTITVTLLDINDHPTVCSPRVYQGTVKENSPIDTSILTVSCTDSDDVTTNPITYHVNTTGSNQVLDAFKYFYFPSSDQSTTLSAKFPMDLERGSLLQFNVDVAQGANLDSSTTTLSVEITVVGENDNVPVMSQDFYNYEFRYDVDIGTEVGTVSATDNDVTNAVLTYDWVYAVTEFDIHSLSGSINTKQDFKINQTFIYHARAQDNDNPPGPDVSKNSPVRFDTFDPELLLIDFEVAQPLSYFTIDKRKEFEAAVSSACPPCLGRISSLEETSSTTTTLTVYALKDATTESYENANKEKQYIPQAQMLDTFRRDDDGTPSPAVALPKFFNFPVVKVTPTSFGLTFLEWLLYTPEGNAVLALTILAALSALIGALIYIWRTGALLRLFRLLMKCNLGNCFQNCCQPSEPKETQSRIKQPDSGGDFNVFEFRYKDKPLVPMKSKKTL